MARLAYFDWSSQKSLNRNGSFLWGYGPKNLPLVVWSQLLPSLVLACIMQIISLGTKQTVPVLAHHIFIDMVYLATI